MRRRKRSTSVSSSTTRTVDGWSSVGRGEGVPMAATGTDSFGLGACSKAMAWLSSSGLYAAFSMGSRKWNDVPLSASGLWMARIAP